MQVANGDEGRLKVRQFCIQKKARRPENEHIMQKHT